MKTGWKIGIGCFVAIVVVASCMAYLFHHREICAACGLRRTLVDMNVVSFGEHGNAFICDDCAWKAFGRMISAKE